METISVIFSAYNAERTIRKAIESVLNNICSNEEYQFNLECR